MGRNESLRINDRNSGFVAIDELDQASFTNPASRSLIRSPACLQFQLCVRTTLD
jgi:hypothetical protein